MAELVLIFLIPILLYTWWDFARRIERLERRTAQPEYDPNVMWVSQNGQNPWRKVNKHE
jgi:hypothetical protein